MGDDGRRRGLSGAVTLPQPPFLAIEHARADELGGVVAALRAGVRATGLGAVQLDRSLTAGELLALGEPWGTPIPEHDPTVQPFVEAGVVLHVVTRWRATEDVDRQPFSASPILLHTESSRRVACDQPRHLVFDCLVPPPPGAGGQTVVVRVDEVVARLDDETSAALREVRCGGPGTSPILRNEGGAAVLSFRDPGPSPPGGVVPAVEALLDALYHPEAMYGLTWVPHLVVVIDNHRIVHGRTAVRADAAEPDRRHLRRLRVLATTPALEVAATQ